MMSQSMDNARKPDPAFGSLRPSHLYGTISPSMHVVTIYGKPDCHLCDEVEQVVRHVARRRRFRLEHKNILDDPALEELYREAVPVIMVDGQEIARFRLTAFMLEAALTK
jgi:hypothetical protein